MFDVVIQGGTVVTPHRTFVANVGVSGEKIAAVDYAPIEGREVIDATGKHVIPGVIDTHVHLQPSPRGDKAEGFLEWTDDYRVGTTAAACGGVTFVFDFPVQAQHDGASVFDPLEWAIKDASSKAVIDFSFHPGLTVASEQTLSEIPKLIDMGIPSMKFYLTYPNWHIRIDVGFLWDAMRVLREHNGIAAVHSEEDRVIQYLKKKLVSQGRTDLAGYADVRPDYAEEMAINQVGILARETGSRAYIVHVSSRKGLEAIKRYKEMGVQLFAEGALHYFFFTREVFDLEPERAALFVMGPPYRTHEDIAYMWQALADGTIDWMCTDHSPFSSSVKRKDIRFYADQAGTPNGIESLIPTGMSGSEVLLPLIYSEGVRKGHLTLERLVDVMCTQPARRLGLNDKGSIEVGKDADIVLIDPSVKKTIRNADLHSNVDFTIYEGIEATGWPVLTMVRGQTVAKDGQFVGREGYGRFVKRTLRY